MTNMTMESKYTIIQLRCRNLRKVGQFVIPSTNYKCSIKVTTFSEQLFLVHCRRPNTIKPNYMYFPRKVG